MKELLKLIDVKSLVTLTLTGTFVYLSVTKGMSESQFMIIFAMVMTFYFAKKDETK